MNLTRSFQRIVPGTLDVEIRDNVSYRGEPGEVSFSDSDKPRPQFPGIVLTAAAGRELAIFLGSYYKLTEKDLTPPDPLLDVVQKSIDWSHTRSSDQTVAQYITSRVRAALNGTTVRY